MVFLLTTIISLLFTFLQIFLENGKKISTKHIFLFLRNVFITDIVSIGLTLKIMGYKHFIHTSEYSLFGYLVLCAISIILSLIIWKMPKILQADYQFPKKHRLVTFLSIISVIIFAIGCIAQYTTQWCNVAFGGVTAEQILINITSPVEGTDPEIILSGIEEPTFSVFFYVTVFCLLLFCNIKPIYIFKNNKGLIFNNLIKAFLCLIVAILIVIKGVSFSFEELSIKQLYRNYFIKSDIIDVNYVNPKETDIQFPEKKRNLIHIYLESIENSYLSKDLGGFMPENLMPELTELSYEGVVFSNTDYYFGGPKQGVGTQWSLASMVNQTTGLPMKAPGGANAYGSDGKFLPGAFALGDILEKQGYEQTIMIGASAKFGSLDCLYSTHGNWKIMDYDYAIENNMLPFDYKINWGFEDDKLYEYAKQEITRLYKTGKPFNFTMETADTHFPNGYVSNGDPTPYQTPYANAILNSTKHVVELIEWIKEQPFYENTTIVLIGDHLSMETRFFEDYHFTDSYQRTQFNLILNPAPNLKIDGTITRNRTWANWDYFPTIIASIGGIIDGDRLGIGTNLFSGKATLYEEYGFDYVDGELQKGSDLYRESILNP